MKGIRVSVIAVSLFFLFHASSILTLAQKSDQVLLLTGATIIDGVTDAPLSGRSLLIEGNTISAILPKGSPAPRGAEVIDLGGRFVIPGLIDSHVHWEDWMGELFLNQGVTTIVAMADISPAARARSHLDKRVPRMYHSGNRIPFSPKDDKKRVLEIVQEWLVKEPDIAHLPHFDDASADVFATWAQAVHAAGLLVFGHAEYAPQAVRAGMDSVEHLWGFALAAMSPADLAAFRQGEFLTWATSMTDWDRLDAMIKEAVASGASLNPTLLYEWGGLSKEANEHELDDYRLVSNPDLVYFPENLARSFLAKHRQIKNFSGRYETLPFVRYLPSGDRAQFESGYKNVREFVRRWAQAGGKIQAGTDTLAGGIPGLSLQHEMQMLVEAGLTPMQALKSATRWSAELLEGKAGARGSARVGSLEPGKRADLVVLGADPLVDIANSTKIERVMKDGEWIDLGYTPDYYTFTSPHRALTGSTLAPVISSVTPAVVNAGSGTVRVALEGTGFLRTSLIRVDGISVKTTVVSPRRVEFDLPAERVASATPHPYVPPTPQQTIGILGSRSIEIHVFNPPPEGGRSNAVHLLVRPNGR